ncbi:MAG: DNA repair protein RecN [Proteobacteria bacterium]|nr:DNA repair protein RecN [Pseudomonadota bacterium]MBT5066117.1 DNA repair protein RecN [Pseudomonadota bacterium]MBT6193711.1 DNA repair protein RecN [Pseudomonadota bacterium]MBT7245483.1 DNA repair protein RecN [Pseudomonadota bacterium]MBT7561456.1 DNA repair protein RecN [Pseudomonadota bacterium]
MIEEANADFGKGLTVITGETGSGKSVFLQALGLALGSKADTQMIRSGEERASISATFNLATGSPALSFLEEHQLDQKNECILRRIINRDARSRAFCNETPITLATLEQLGRLLVDVHAQHAGRKIVDSAAQREQLDAYGKLEEKILTVKSVFQEWKSLSEQLKSIDNSDANEARKELLEYQILELEDANLDLDELSSIESEYKMLAKSDGYIASLKEADVILSGNENTVVESLRTVIRYVKQIASEVPAAANLSCLLEQAEMSTEEAIHELGLLGDSLEQDPKRLTYLDDRLRDLHALSRKHGIELQRLNEKYVSLQNELGSLTSKSAETQSLAKNIVACRTKFDAAAKILSLARMKVRTRMSKEITEKLKLLDMPYANFEISIHSMTDSEPHSSGVDQVEFLVSTNPESSLCPLGKIASGGELSRISLAVQSSTAAHSQVPCVIYDEVDTGIGGDTANTVGENLLLVASHCQVICITHSPQVAGAGTSHLLMEKKIINKQSSAQVKAVFGKSRESEISRMLGAKKGTTSSIAHARDLIEVHVKSESK